MSLMSTAQKIEGLEALAWAFWYHDYYGGLPESFFAKNGKQPKAEVVARCERVIAEAMKKVERTTAPTTWKEAMKMTAKLKLTIKDN